MGNEADPLTRANYGHGIIQSPSVRAHYGLVDFFKLVANALRTFAVYLESRLFQVSK